MAAAPAPETPPRPRLCEIENVGATKLQDLISDIDVLLVTTTPVEREAVLSRLRPLRGEKAVLEGNIGALTMRIGHFGQYFAAHVEYAMGSVGRDASALTLADAIKAVDPKAILILGIAFGLNRQKQKLGDVIVAEEVIPYEPAKLGECVESRGRSILAGPVLYERFRNRHSDWTESRGSRKVNVICGPILSGEKLVDNLSERNELIARYPRAVGGEMEAAGAYAAANRKGCEILMVKAISDFADGKKAKTKDKQPFAASMAVSLAWHVLSKPDVLSELGALDRGLPDEPTRDVAILSPRDQLVEGIDALPQPWAGRIRSFIDAYVGTAERPNVFCGRDEDVQQLLQWLERDDVPPNLLVTAPAGRGKSALLVRAAMKWATCEDIDVVFIPWSARYDTNRPDVFLGALVARIARLRRRNAPDLKHTNADILEKMLHDELAQPYTEGRKLVIMLDGLDEAVGFDIKPGFLPPSHFNSIRLIVSARHQPDDPQGDRWIRNLGWIGLDITDRLLLPPLEIQDVEAALNRLPRSLNSLSLRHDIAIEIQRLCAGDPLTLWLMVIDIVNLGEHAIKLDVKELRARPPGLDGYFDQWWQQQRKQWNTEAPRREKSARALLELLAVADGRLTRDDVLALLPDEIPDGVRLNDTLQDLSRLIQGDGAPNGYVLAHPGFGQYWRGQIGKHACQKWRKRIECWIEQTTDDFFAERLSAKDLPKYIVQHRVEHLQEQRASRERWMTLATRPWYDAWQAHEPGPSGFLDNVNSAWTTIAIDGGQYADEAQCALVRGSIGSTLTQITPDLLKLLLDEGIWAPEQAFAYVRAAPATNDSDKGRGRLTETLAPYLTDALLPDIFKLACDLENVPFQRIEENVFRDLLKRMASIAPAAARSALERIPSLGSRSLRLCMLAEHLPAESRATVLQRSLELARQVDQPFPRVYLLRDIAEKLVEPERGRILHEAFAAANEIKELRERQQRFCELLPLLPDDLRSQAFDQALATAVASCENSDHPLDGLRSLIEQVSAPFREHAIATLEEIVRTRKTLAEGWYICMKILPYAPEDQHEHWVELAFSIINSIDDDGERATAIIRTLDEAAEIQDIARQAVVNHALRLAEKVTDPWSRLGILEKLRNHVLSETLWRAAEPTWPSIVDCLRSEDSLYERFVFDEILDIAPLDMALHAVRQSPYPWVRAELLLRLAKGVPMEERSSLIAEIFVDIGNIVLARKRADLYRRMLFDAPEHQRDAIFGAMVRSIEEIAEPYLRTLELMRLVHLLNAPWRANALDAALASARTIDMPHARFDQLLHIATHASADKRDSVLQEALDTVMQESQPWLQCKHIVGLAKVQLGRRRHEMLRLALKLSRTIGDDTNRVQAMLSFARYLPPAEMNALIDDIERIPGADQRFEKYLHLFVDCPPERTNRFDLALVAARLAGRAPGNHAWAYGLARLVPFAPAERREPLLREVLALTREQLNSLERPPPVAHLEDQYADHSGMTIDAEVCANLQQIAAFFPHEMVLEALSLAGQLGNLHHRTQATIALALQLPENERINIGESILSADVQPSHYSSRRDVRHAIARSVAPLFPEPRRSELAASPRERQPFEVQIPDLHPEQSDAMLAKNISELLAIDKPGIRIQVIPSFLSRFSAERRDGLVRHVLDRIHVLQPFEQDPLLLLLLPYVPDAWIDRCLDALERYRNLTVWVFSSVVHRFDVRQLDRAIDLVEATPGGGSPRDARLDALAAIGVERMKRPNPPRVRLQKIVHDALLRRSESRANVMIVLSAMAPLIVELGGQEAAIGVVNAIRGVGKWWA